MCKVCTKCKKEQDLSQYPKYSGYKDGHSSWCRTCLKDRARIWDSTNKDRKKEHSRNWESRNPRSRASAKFKNRCGITIESYEEMLSKQNGECAICKKAGKENLKGKLFVDHCHSTLIVRGLLCHDCNDGLGRFKDNTFLLNKAIQYLQESSKRSV
jgi:hypothetical protein